MRLEARERNRISIDLISLRNKQIAGDSSYPDVAAVLVVLSLADERKVAKQMKAGWLNQLGASEARAKWSSWSTGADSGRLPLSPRVKTHKTR